MIDEDDNNIFLNLLQGVKPIKKNNRITKPIPKQKKALIKKTELKINEIKKSRITTETPFQKNEPKKQNTQINKRLKKGQISINRKVDFHGYSLHEAKQLFFDTINDCYLKNFRCILFITGKGIKKSPKDNLEKTKLYYGKIRNALFDWLMAEEISSKILNVQQANLKYGGDGAFFVYLRKNKN